MKGVRTHKQAIDKIAEQLGIPREDVERICDMMFNIRGLPGKMIAPNEIELPYIGLLKPVNANVRQKKLRKLYRVYDNAKKKRQRAEKKKRNEVVPQVEEYQFELAYLEKLINSNFNYYPWQTKSNPHKAP